MAQAPAQHAGRRPYDASRHEGTSEIPDTAARGRGDDGGTRVVVIALGANLAIAATKFVAAAFTASSAMASEGVHSLVDTVNELLLLYGIRRARRPPDRKRPLGYGRELYFWSFVVSLLVFALGTGVSVFEGIAHLREPHALEHPLVNYAVLGAAALFEGVSWCFTLRKFRREKGDRGYIEAFRASKDPSTFTVLFEDTAALIGLAIAAAGIAGAQAFGLPQLDGVASLGIGLVLAVSSLLLARETKQLLIGEPAHPHIRESILAIAGAEPGVRRANGVITAQLGPDQIVAALSAEFDDALTADDIEACIQRIEHAIRAEHPDVAAVFVKPQSEQTWQRRSARIGDASRNR